MNKEIPRVISGRFLNLDIVQDTVWLDKHYYLDIFLNKRNGKKCLETLLKEISSMDNDEILVRYNGNTITLEDAIVKIEELVKSYNLITVKIEYSKFEEKYILKIFKETTADTPEEFYFLSFGIGGY